jgi:hypothetical protein
MSPKEKVKYIHDKAEKAKQSWEHWQWGQAP